MGEGSKEYGPDRRERRAGFRDEGVGSMGVRAGEGRGTGGQWGGRGGKKDHD